MNKNNKKALNFKKKYKKFRRFALEMSRVNSVNELDYFDLLCVATEWKN